jgi:hypothetical protein
MISNHSSYWYLFGKNSQYLSSSLSSALTSFFCCDQPSVAIINLLCYIMGVFGSLLSWAIAQHAKLAQSGYASLLGLHVWFSSF